MAVAVCELVQLEIIHRDNWYLVYSTEFRDLLKLCKNDAKSYMLLRLIEYIYIWDRQLWNKTRPNSINFGSKLIFISIFSYIGLLIN